MKFFSLCKDGGPESTVWGYFATEIKSLFSLVLLRFEAGTRDAYHSHAFNCVSWVLKGKLEERHIDGEVMYHEPSIFPIMTLRGTTHQVFSHGRTWVISVRGPWAENWKEIENGEEHTLTHGRRVVS